MDQSVCLEFLKTLLILMLLFWHFKLPTYLVCQLLFKKPFYKFKYNWLVLTYVGTYVFRTYFEKKGFLFQNCIAASIICQIYVGFAVGRYVISVMGHVAHGVEWWRNRQILIKKICGTVQQRTKAQKIKFPSKTLKTAWFGYRCLVEDFLNYHLQMMSILSLQEANHSWCCGLALFFPTDSHP